MCTIIHSMLFGGAMFGALLVWADHECRLGRGCWRTRGIRLISFCLVLGITGYMVYEVFTHARCRELEMAKLRDMAAAYTQEEQWQGEKQQGRSGFCLDNTGEARESKSREWRAINI